jgi:hypothetical protein
MPYIRFSIQVDTEDEEPSRVIRKIDGTIFEYAEESDKEKNIGDLQCLLVQPSFAEEKGQSLCDAMDSISDETMECYDAVFDPDTDEWTDSVQELYSGGPISADLLFIDKIELDAKHRVLVQPEMDSGRSPLASIAPFSAGQSATAQYSCG